MVTINYHLKSLTREVKILIEMGKNCTFIYYLTNKCLYLQDIYA